jgi:hypothetical protein
MRTDSEIVAWVAPLFDPAVAEELKHDRMDAIVGAMSCGLGGREALEAAMGAIKLEIDGPPQIWRTGVQRIADEIDTGDRSTWPRVREDPNIMRCVQYGAALAVRIDELQRVPSDDPPNPFCSVCGGLSCSHMNGVGAFPS